MLPMLSLCIPRHLFHKAGYSDKHDHSQVNWSVSQMRGHVVTWHPSQVSGLSVLLEGELYGCWTGSCKLAAARQSLWSGGPGLLTRLGDYEHRQPGVWRLHHRRRIYSFLDVYPIAHRSLPRHPAGNGCSLRDWLDCAVRSDQSRHPCSLTNNIIADVRP